MKSDENTSPEYDAFKDLLGKVLSVPHSEIVKREAEYRRKAALNPNRRGPKPRSRRKTRS